MINHRESTKAEEEPQLVQTPEGLTLQQGNLQIRGDFLRMLPRLRRGNLEREQLVKAARIRGLQTAGTVFDATAGLGEDSLLLAAAGWNVTMCEFDPVIAALLRDSLKRAAEVPELCEIVARMQLTEGDSRALLPHLDFTPDLVLLDPMFPERQKSGLVKKKAQLLQKLEKPCDDEAGLFEAAIRAYPRKVVVKRPLKGPHLAGKKPDYAISGKTIRYDCYVLSV